ncbi:MAG: DNA polymerase III subunit gamma/tau [Mycoplasmoidaceae bacterium]
MNKTLYRKYKPLNFLDLIGQNYIKKILLNSLNNDMVSHAYIFSGPRGVGKTSVARIFSKAINCLNKINGDACLSCANCIIFDTSEAMDVIELDAASNNGVAEIRNLIDSTKFLPNVFNKKIYIIDEAHMLTNNSWNALLKTLEDPPKDVIFIFATTEVNKIPLTIISRCQRFDFEKISNENLQAFIKKIASAESIIINNDAIDEIINLSGGSVRDCLSTLNQITNYSDEKITANTVQEIFGIIDSNGKLALINLILKRDIVAVTHLIDKFELKGINFYKLTFQLIEILLDKLFYLKSDSFNNLKILSKENINDINLEETTILNLIEILQNGIIQIKNNVDDKFFFELIMLNCISYLKKTNTKEPEEEIMNNKLNKDQDFIKEKLDISIDTKIEEFAPKVISDKDVEDLKYIEVKFEDVVTSRKVAKNQEQNYNILKAAENAPPYKLKELIIEPQNVPSEIKTEKEEIEAPIKPHVTINHLDDKEDLLWNKLDEDLIKSFSEIAFNNNNEIKSRLNETFNLIKDRIPKYPEEGYVCDASKILVASQNGIVFLFDDEVSALNLNLIADNEDFLMYIKKQFKNLYKVIGVSREQARKFSEFVKELKTNFKTYPDVNIEKLKLKVKSNATTQEIALEIFGEDFKK